MIDTNENTSPQPWTKVTQSVDEYTAEARANLHEAERMAHAQIRQFFAEPGERLERDLERLAQDLALQRAEEPRDGVRH